MSYCTTLQVVSWIIHIVDDNEYIDYIVPAGGTYYIKVYYDDQGNQYDLWWDDFQPPDRTLTVSKSGTGSGMVTSSPAGIDCGSTCSYAFAYNTVVTLTPLPLARPSPAGVVRAREPAVVLSP